MKKSKTTETEVSEVEPRIYELGYLLSPYIAEEKIGAEVEKIKKFLVSAGAAVIAEEEPYLRDLAYEIIKMIANKNEKFTQGYFGWIKFEASPEAAESTKIECDNNKGIVRYLLVKTVRENTVYTKRPNKAEINPSKEEGTGEAIAEVPEEVPAEVAAEEPTVEVVV